MPRPLYIALIATLCFAFTARAEDKPSPAVKRILDKAVGKVRANRQEFDKANKKPLDEARAELQELVTRLNKDGKTKEAIDTLKQVETLEADVMKMANAPAPVAGGGAVPRKPLLERLEGKWTHPNHGTVYIVESVGGIQEVFKADGRLHTKGQLQLMADGTAETVMTNGMKYKLREAGTDTLAIELWDAEGKPQFVGFVLTRIK